jgi:hypothetical protein
MTGADRDPHAPCYGDDRKSEAVKDQVLCRHFEAWPQLDRDARATDVPSDKGQTGSAPQSACYWHAIGGLSAYYLGRISTVTAIFPARIFKVL